MLFGVSFCRRNAYKRSSRIGSLCLRISLLTLGFSLAVLLLFLAPHWLLVLLVVLLAAALIALAACSGCRRQ